MVNTVPGISGLQQIGYSMAVVNKMNGDSTARQRQIIMRMGHVEPE